MLTRAWEARRHRRSVAIVSDEPEAALTPVSRALEERGIECSVLPAGSVTCVEATYIRAIDRSLVDSSSFARIAALGTYPNLLVNLPGSVRLAEWIPLATHALRERGVPQPTRLWCFDRSDVGQAVATLGPNVVVEGAVSRTRMRTSSQAEACDAFDLVVGGHSDRGALVESSIRGATAELSILVVDSERIPLPGRSDRRLPAAARRRAALVAARAVTALGGSVMAVDVVVNQHGEAHVVRVDACPPLHGLSERALEAVMHAISRRVRAASLIAPKRVAQPAAGERLVAAGG